MPLTRVAITGMDLVTALGPTLDATWCRLVAGDCGIRPISFFDATEYGCCVAAEVGDTPIAGADGASSPLSQIRRGVRFFAQAVRGAWRDAGLDADPPTAAHAGIAVGVSVNYINHAMLRHHFRFRAD